MEKNLFLCSCSSFEHQMFFWYDEEDDILYVESHLSTWRGFFRRLWYGLRYAFGHKSRFGAWDEFLFEQEDLDKLYKFLKDVKNEKEESQEG
jgi:hypothetical protein